MSAREASPAPDYIARAEALAPLIQELAPAIERERRLPQKLVDRMIDAGLFRMLLPRDYDGGETDPMTFVQVLEAIARHDASTAWCLGQTGVCATASAFLPAESARAIWGDRRGILAWGAAPNVKAIAAPGGWRVTGSWSFASGGHHASWIGGHCIACDADGTPRRSATGGTVPRTLLFPAEKVAWTD
ncbi:MAG TPA: acyl-CoA dehydrogenase family protein, partial [Stellaceae bacterium]|nr:acyl-CoA dehydrogenase family protein [Stellaceae bacterium]